MFPMRRGGIEGCRLLKLNMYGSRIVKLITKRRNWRGHANGIGVGETKTYDRFDPVNC